ncbi:MAG: hypothetical protein JO099_02685, partial [Acidobacteriia bacterium]|nr:hypothetical protein [Terriglobia bacterium]
MALRASVLGIMLAFCRCASALNPSLDINQYAHSAWTARDGFFKGTMTSIAQTPDGYLWVGTEFGLLRFDGVRSVSWQPPAGQHLPSNSIRSLLAARDGRLWIGTAEGLASWKDLKLTHYAELAGQDVFPLLEDRDGTLWAAGRTPAGTLCAIQTGSVHCYRNEGSFDRGAATLYEDSGGNLWAAAETRLWRWKPGPPKVYPMPSPGVTHSQALSEDNNGPLLIATQSGIKR